MDFGLIFIDFLLQHIMAEVAKIVDRPMFFFVLNRSSDILAIGLFGCFV